MKTITNLYIHIFIIAFGMCLSSALRAELLTDVDSLLWPVNTIDFSQFNSEHYHITGPVNIGGLVDEDIFASSPSSLLSLWNGAYGLGANGNWGLSSQYSMHGYIAADYGVNNSVFIDFNGESISGFLSFMNYQSRSQSLRLRAYDDVGILLEEFDILDFAPISTPGAMNGGAWRGIQRREKDIYRIEIAGTNGFVLDNLAFTRAVPEPSRLSFFIMGGAVLIIWMKRRKNSGS